MSHMRRDDVRASAKSCAPAHQILVGASLRKASIVPRDEWVSGRAIREVVLPCLQALLHGAPGEIAIHDGAILGARGGLVEEGAAPPPVAG